MPQSPKYARAASRRAVPRPAASRRSTAPRPLGVAGAAALVLAGVIATNASAAPAPDACDRAAIPSGERLVDVPFDTVDSRIYVAARVDGRGPFRFALDTGASGMARADAQFAEALGAAPGAGASTSDGVRTAAVETTRLRWIALGGLVRNDLDVITRDYASRVSAAARFDGILARDFFADGLLLIDYRARRLVFSRAAGLPADAAGALPYERAFRIPVTIGDVQATAQLDTGADVALVMPRALYDRVAGGPLAAAGGATLANGRIRTQRGRVVGPVRIGEVALHDAEVRVASDFPEMLVGAPALAGARVLIDPRTKRVAVCR